MAVDCLELAAFRAMPPQSIETVLLLGPASREQLEQVQAAFPALRSVAVVSLSANEDPRLAPPERLGALTVTRIGIEGSAPLEHVYVRVAQFFLAHGASVARTLVVPTSWSERQSGDLAKALAGGVHDLVVARGRAFARRLVEGAVEGRAFARVWADTLLSQGEALHAVRLYLALAELGTPELAVCVGIVKAWCALEQPGQALAWLDRCEMPAPAAEAMRQDLEAVRAEQDAAQRACWTTNFAHLQRSFPGLAEALRSVVPAPADLVWLLEEPWRLQAARTREPVVCAEYPLLVRVEGGLVHELNAPEVPEWLYGKLRATQDVMTAHAVVAELTRLDALYNIVVNAVTSSIPGRRQVVYGVASDLSLLRRFAEVQDLRGLLQPQRIELFWGADAEARIADNFRRYAGRPIPGICLPTSPCLSAQLETVLAERVADYRRAAIELEQYDDARLPARTLAKLESGTPLRIWAWSSRHTTVLQYIASDLQAAFERLGHRFDLLIEDDERDLVDRRAVSRSLLACQPDVLLFLDHFRPQFKDIVPKHTPTFAWFLDEVPQLRDPAMIAGLGPQDLCFAWSESLTADLTPRGFPFVDTLPFAANEQRYVGLGGASPVAEDSIAFITHLSPPADEPFAPGFMAAMAAEFSGHDLIPSGHAELAPLVDRVAHGLGVRLDGEQRERLICSANAAGRHSDRLRIADALLAAGLPLALYGRGWEAIPRFSGSLRGVVAPGEALRAVYQRHKVILHINTRCNMHPRVIETMLAGGFVLARSDGDFDTTPGGTGDYFAIDRELCLFRDLPDLQAKAARALHDEAWRQGVSEAGRERVLREHTYRHRAERMLERLRLVLQRSFGIAA